MKLLKNSQNDPTLLEEGKQYKLERFLHKRHKRLYHLGLFAPRFLLREVLLVFIVLIALLAQVVADLLVIGLDSHSDQ